MAIRYAPIDRLEAEIRRLTREGERVLNYAPDPHKNQWVILTEDEPERRDDPAPEVEKRAGTADHSEAVESLIETHRGTPKARVSGPGMPWTEATGDDQ